MLSQGNQKKDLTKMTDTNTLSISNEFYELISQIEVVEKVITKSESGEKTVEYKVLKDLPLATQKILWVILIEAKKQGIRERYTFYKSRIIEGAGLSKSNAWRDITRALNLLRRIEWDEIEEDKKADLSGILSDPLFENGIIKEVSLSRKIKDMLFHSHKDGNYTKTSEDRSKLKCRYAIKLYDTIRVKITHGHRRFTLEDLKKHLKAPYKYKWYDFDRECLKKAVKEINKECTFNVSASPVKSGNRVTDIDIAITTKSEDNPVICKRTSEQITWENELSERNNVEIAILDKVRIKHRLNIDHMIRFWNEYLKDVAQYHQLSSRGPFILKHYYDKDKEMNIRFGVASFYYTKADWETEDLSKTIPSL
jgi:plasmid replication initiation protein